MSCRALVVVVSIGFAGMIAGCGGDTAQVDGAYESCTPGDICDSSLSCEATSLASSNYAGDLCTTNCQVDTDCPSLIDSYSAICVNAQCYTQCASDGDCPYGTGCFSFTDTSGDVLQVCTP